MTSLTVMPFTVKKLLWNAKYQSQSECPKYNYEEVSKNVCILTNQRFGTYAQGGKP